MENFNNSIHIKAIKRAMKNKNAAVMVGAGFSRNAENGHLLKTWGELAEEISKELEPDGKASQHAASQVTQLGEQYSRAFSVPALEELLKRNIPDQSVSPGQLHDELLKLPWSEIFTTNYDTLLERAADKIFESSHFTICSREDIPLSKILGRRRIVKLHGSFPSQRPFIFTEEDYRTYPERFSPFINLVRQSLIENVFCLIGFSGDDPNFLNWIGWVRDVLEKHANPVYLLLGSEPTHGNRKLLEARGVTPVVIPSISSGVDNSYSNRYLKLFEILREPIEKNSLDWGKVSFDDRAMRSDTQPEAQCEIFLTNLGVVSRARKEYPGWLVAPPSVRTHFKINVREVLAGFQNQEIWAELKKKTPEENLICYSLYSWSNKVILEPMDDVVSQRALEVLFETHSSRDKGPSSSVLEKLRFLGVSNRHEYCDHWDNLARELLHWARQTLRSSEVKRLLGSLSSLSSPSAEMLDHIAHEKVLFNLYQADRIKALEVLNDWEPVSSDPFFLVIKSSLLAEVGDYTRASSLCNKAIQRLRKMQRDTPESNDLLSKEAWACLVCHNIQNGIRFSIESNGRDYGVGVDALVEDLDKRLTTLSRHGYDCHLILKEVLSDLNSEAFLASETKVESHGFRLGSLQTKRKFGVAKEISDKINAAFQWLEITERVGLAPRVGRTTFYLDSYLQAAWWTQYNDTTERMLSVLIRTQNTNALKPKDETAPPHKTGWLSRFHVATIPEYICEEICERLLSQVEFLVRKQVESELLEICSFYLEVFSRLVVRVKKEEAERHISRLANIYCTGIITNFQAHNTWRALNSSISSAVENLSEDDQKKVVKDIVKIPLRPSGQVPPHFESDWLSPYRLQFVLRNNGVCFEDESVVSHIDFLIQTLSAANDVTSSDYKVWSAWERACWLRQLGFLRDEHKEVLSQLLWRDAQVWPVIPGFLPHATFDWIPSEIQDAKKRFAEWCLSKNISGFIAGPSSSVQLKLKDRPYSWNTRTDNEAFELWLESLRKGDWNSFEPSSIFHKVNAWWDQEGEMIENDVGSSDELHVNTLIRFDLIDKLFFRLLQNGFGCKVDVEDFVSRTSPEYAPFWRVRVLECEDGVSEEKVYAEALSALMDGDRVKASLAYDSIGDLSVSDKTGSLSTCINAITSLLITENTTALRYSFEFLCRFLKESDICLNDYQFFMIQTGLAKLKDKLSYDGKGFSYGIDDSAIPLLRFQCVCLAYLLNLKGYLADESPIKKWLCGMNEDPLPELRYHRYKLN